MYAMPTPGIEVRALTNSSDSVAFLTSASSHSRCDSGMFWAATSPLVEPHGSFSMPSTDAAFGCSLPQLAAHGLALPVHVSSTTLPSWMNGEAAPGRVTAMSPAPAPGAVLIAEGAPPTLVLNVTPARSA